jgi:hypothetical protein
MTAKFLPACHDAGLQAAGTQKSIANFFQKK